MADIRAKSTNKPDLGTKFEQVTKDFLKTDRLYRNRFSKVWLWHEWPKNDGHDTGIDLIAEESTDGSLCAIQCKCYADDGGINMKAVSTFLAKAASLNIENKILVYTGDTITDNAEKLLRKSGCRIIRQSHMRESTVDWSQFPILVPKKPNKLWPHQQTALTDVLAGFKKHDRGKMIMACGTGKTLTSLHIAEKHAGRGKMILYLVPSISLILQTMREWSENANMRHYYMSVCSDKSTGEDGSITELESPVSTDAKKLVPFIKSRPKDAMTVIFSTYHSIDVVQKAVKKERFDIIFCDEAHRTTGVEDKSFFTTVHKDSNIRGKKRLYMTATPRIYNDAIQARMGKTIYSMDNEEKYGPEFHNLSFADAVKQDILSDFKVKIAIVPADKVDKEFQQAVSTPKKGVGDRVIPLDERTLLAAVWHGLQYPDDKNTPKLLQRVIAFANRIDRSMMFAGLINDSDDINRSFKNIVDAWEKKFKSGNNVEVKHIDGKTRALERRNRMNWLNESTDDPKTCRIVTNAKCLSEGVDVPALDGVIFLNPRKSRVDVVQSVGRVMRKSDGKEYGYVILPVALPAGMEYHEALDDNKTFKVVWQVLNALRSHDENFGAEINKLILSTATENTEPTPRISVDILDSDFVDTEPVTKFFDKVKSKLVEKVGDIDYYDRYGRKLGSATHTIESRLKNKMAADKTTKAEIVRFHDGLKKMINDSITERDTIQAISQHMVLSPVFNELFSGQFTSHNPISIAFNKVIHKIGLEEELEELEEFYNEVSKEVSQIKTGAERQAFIKKIYGNFFESADPEGTEQHGIVYTPIEVIDFIIHSVQRVLKTEFSTGFNDRTVKVLEPFAGTGTFIVRLLESGYITDNLYKKYKHDLYANELILLAYYVATINIETTYSSLQKDRYVPFEGINYTDTLMVNPKYREDPRHRRIATKIDGTFKEVHQRMRRQKESPVHVIIGNPPYSGGQDDFNENVQNRKYPELDNRIKDTYIQRLAKINPDLKNIVSLYDSYIRSIRWVSDRIGNLGVIAFITNASFIRSETTAGLRASLQEEFNEIWCFDLRGNQRTQGEMSRKEGGKIFGSGSRAPVAITILVKNPKKQGCTIHYKDIGDYHSQEKKLEIIRDSKSIASINDWQTITPDKYHDWLNQRNPEFTKYTPMGSKNAKSGKDYAVFKTYSRGTGTGRDAWTYNSSVKELSKNMRRHIDYCIKYGPHKPNNVDPTQAKWDSHLSSKLLRNSPDFNKKKIREALYRPFFKQYLYYDSIYNQEQPGPPSFFPKNDSENLVICVPYKFMSEFSTFITNVTPDLEVTHHGQCFPLYIYEEDNTTKNHNIANTTLQEYQQHYAGKKITQEDIFYYVYGLLHHSGYKEKFANNLSRELPRIPMAPDFWAFSKAGRKLAKLHLNYETCGRYRLGKQKNRFDGWEEIAYSKTKDSDGKPILDKTKLRIKIRTTKVWVEIYDKIPSMTYQVNGRTPLEWIMDRYRRTVDTKFKSYIVKDPTAGMTERKTIEMIERILYVSVKSDKIIKELSKLPFEPKNWKPKKTGMDQYIDDST